MEHFLTNRLLIFDGGIGTELYQRGFYINRPFEELNLSSPIEVQKVHEDYLGSGADVITTNTFASTAPQLRKFDIQDRQYEIVLSALQIANRAQATAMRECFIGVSIGPMGDLVEPLGRIGLDEAEEVYGQVARAAYQAVQNSKPDAALKFDFYNLETFSNLDELRAALRGVRAIDQNRPILASVHARSGQIRFIEDLAKKIARLPEIQAIGLNCSEGPSDLLRVLQALRPLTHKPIIVQPNAGIPRSLNGRYFYMTSPDYMAKYAKRFVEAGASGVGGCCGTGPEHIQAIQQALSMMNVKSRVAEVHAIHMNSAISVETSKPVSLKDRPQSPIAKALLENRKIRSLEVLPPKGTELTKFLEGVDQIEKFGIEFINIPDGARASTRVGSLHLAAFLAHQNRSIKVLPHFTTRDRNLIALQSDLLGAYVNGVHDILLVTGDPPKLGTNKDATAVYDIDSIGLTYLVNCLNHGISLTGDELGLGTQFGIGVASNPTAISLETEHQRWKYKVESGADFAVTQPIFDPEAFLRWRDLVGSSYRPHIVGIWPLVSLRNAEFMANEVPGVSIPKWVIDEIAKAGDDKAEATKRGVDIAHSIVTRLNSSCEGFCVSAPLGKIPVALEVFKAL